MLSLSSGVYGADLGPDPRDTSLTAQAFGSNQLRLARLKKSMDPHNVLAYAFPLTRIQSPPKVIFLVTGESCAGKDFSADGWVPVFTSSDLTASKVSISDATKREYAKDTGADLERLLWDRTFNEEHRTALTEYFKVQVQRRPWLPKQHFLEIVHSAANIDVLLITGMRDEAPVATFSSLVPGSRLIEVHVQASEQTRHIRRGWNKDNGEPKLTALNDRPGLVFVNETTGTDAAKKFAENRLLPFLHDDLQRLTKMVRQVPDSSRPGVEFRHVLGISQHPGGLDLCTSLLKSHFTGDWSDVKAVVCCEAGGFIFAPALALQVKVPLVLIREAGKLPQPTVSVMRPTSYISGLSSGNTTEKRFEMNRDVIPQGASVVVVDDVLSTGKTLCAVLQLLDKADMDIKVSGVMVVAEFPLHGGRQLLCRRGFGKIGIQSLLVFDGA